MIRSSLKSCRMVQITHSTISRFKGVDLSPYNENDKAFDSDGWFVENNQPRKPFEKETFLSFFWGTKIIPKRILKNSIICIFWSDLFDVIYNYDNDT